MAIYIKGLNKDKRAKEVFSSIGDVVEAYFARDRDCGRTSSSTVFFNRDKIYSYGHHYLMAVIYADIGIMLVNSDRYSNSTSNHLGYIHHAMYSNIDVPNPNTSNGHNENIEYLSNKIDNGMDNMVKAKRSIKYVAESYIKAIETYNQYVRAFGLKLDYKDYNRNILNEMIEDKERIGNNRALKSSLKWLSGKIDNPIMSYEAPYMIRNKDGKITSNKNKWGSFSLEDILKVLSCKSGEIKDTWISTTFSHLDDGSIKIDGNTLEKKYVDVLKEQIKFVDSSINSIVL